ncbi:transmembrane amino acid transporter protein-domain-containing protein [Radiomyces spectabilis]|uniref:transmembrane amino acid transporter protein-domain-containing protein n=1 Tax=Radiomyces spectabilis TaxID=64574 RepID=UPI0022201971|nr:transmembrane amino acid transporter protein-domain-containing protein [Radiomyces spectabilis]KAI8371331.1 transmembrane amino acid transporter protein-domain-containing protein [Radiomyces spectabilis]
MDEKDIHPGKPSEAKSIESLEYNLNEDTHSIKFSHGVEREAQGSSFLAYFNIVCVVAGTGALGLPYALKQGGWIGLLILGLSWLFSSYSGVILVRCLYYNGRTRLSSYQEVAEAAFGAIGGWLAFFFTAISLIGVPALYVMLAGQNISSMCQGTAAELTPPIWVIICAAIVAIPFVLFKSMKEVGFLSAFGMLATVIVVFIVLVESVKDIPNQTNIIHDPVIWDQFPIALSSIAFSFGGNPVYANVEAGMRRPQDWAKAVTGGLSTCAALYFLTAVPGYYVYGQSVQSPVYNSIPTGPAKIACAAIITAHVILAMPILLTSFALDLEKLCRISTFNHSKIVEALLRFALRTTLIVVVVVIAIFVPFFGDFMSLLGAFSNCALIFIFPVLFYYKLTGLRNKSWYELILGFFVVLLGVVGLIFGTISSVKALNADINGH